MAATHLAVLAPLFGLLVVPGPSALLSSTRLFFLVFIVSAVDIAHLQLLQVAFEHVCMILGSSRWWEWIVEVDSRRGNVRTIALYPRGYFGVS